MVKTEKLIDRRKIVPLWERVSQGRFVSDSSTLLCSSTSFEQVVYGTVQSSSGSILREIFTYSHQKDYPLTYNSRYNDYLIPNTGSAYRIRLGTVYPHWSDTTPKPCGFR